MKTALLITIIFFNASSLWAQSDLVKYPEPEFANEVFYLKKDNTITAVRLEKNTSKAETKTKLGGFGGFEYGYIIEGVKSPVRLPSGELAFIYSASGTSRPSSLQTDSIMRAHGMDPSTVAGMSASMNDPSRLISFYKVENEKGERKIKEGYWELLVDKPLEKGEYAFTISQSMGSMDGGITIFAFGID